MTTAILTVAKTWNWSAKCTKSITGISWSKILSSEVLWLISVYLVVYDLVAPSYIVTKMCLLMCCNKFHIKNQQTERFNRISSTL